MSDRPNRADDHETRAESLSPEQATQLWNVFRTTSPPAGRDALDRLYRSLRHPLVRFCRLKGCDPELADEIAEAAFIRLIVRKPTPRRGFIPLLHKTAQNLCRDAQKRRPQSDPPPISPESAAADVRVIHDESVEAVRDCLNTLDPEDRALLIYHHVEGLTQQAAAELLGLRAAPSTIAVRLKRIRDALARCLKKKRFCSELKRRPAVVTVGESRQPSAISHQLKRCVLTCWSGPPSADISHPPT